MPCGLNMSHVKYGANDDIDMQIVIVLVIEWEALNEQTKMHVAI